MTWLTARLLARHAANVAKAHPWLPGHSCHTTKGAEMAQDPPSSDSQPLTPDSGTELRLGDSEALTESCPDSCGGQMWSWTDTNYGRRWRCDTCHRIVSRHISDAIQAADDRRSL